MIILVLVKSLILFVEKIRFAKNLCLPIPLWIDVGEYLRILYVWFIVVPSVQIILKLKKVLDFCFHRDTSHVEFSLSSVNSTDSVLSGFDVLY